MAAGAYPGLFHWGRISDFVPWGGRISDFVLVEWRNGIK